MDAKRLLSILDEDLTDANVEMAIAWLKTKKPTNKSARRVLKKIFNHPKMHLGLGLLSDWSKAGSWDFIDTDFRELQSLEVFNWVVDLLNANPNHPEAGELWVSLLVGLRHELLEPGATKWLQGVNPLEHECAPLMVAILLEQNQEEWLVSIAKQLLKKQVDEMLLEALIEYVGDEDANAMGVAFLESDASYWSKKRVITALFTRDFEKYQQLVSDLLNEYANERVHSLLQQLSLREPKSAKIVCEWLEQHFESESAQDFLAHPTITRKHDEPIPLIWSWFQHAARSDANLEIFLRMIESANRDLPTEVHAFISEWIQNNQEHSHIELAKRAISTREERIRLDLVGCNWNVDTMERRDACKLEKLLRLEKSPEAINVSRQYLAKFPHGDVSFHVALELYKITLEPSDLLVAKKSIDQRELDIDHLCMLIKLEDTDSLTRGIEMLHSKQFYRACDRARGEIGKLLLTILPKQPNNPTVLERAEEWLRIKPNKYEREMADEMSAMINYASKKV